MDTKFNEFKNLMSHPIKFRWFLFTQLPIAFFSGVRVIKIEEDSCEVTVPYQWFSKNPFRSTYFACLSMAAEMSTGALALGHLYKINPVVSMLVVKSNSEFYKKATNITTFVCNEGLVIKQMVAETVASGEARTATVKSVGKNIAGEVVAIFQFTWSFKAKKLNSAF